MAASVERSDSGLVAARQRRKPVGLDFEVLIPAIFLDGNSLIRFYKPVMVVAVKKVSRARSQHHNVRQSMPATQRTELRNHCLGIVACSVAAFLFLMFVTSVGWDVGDARSGDVVRPESSFSTFEKICFEISRAITIPARWFRFSDSTTGEVAIFSMLLLAYGAIGYLSLRLLLRRVRHYSFKTHS